MSVPAQAVEPSRLRSKVAVPWNGRGGVTVAEERGSSKAKAGASVKVLAKRAMRSDPRCSSVAALKRSIAGVGEGGAPRT